MLYISPLKALAVDIERNLRAPLTGIRHAAHRLGLDEPDIAVAVRTGDTAAEERRKLISKPPDILITTPESLFLLLTSQARETLRGVETVIVDEVHAVAGNKRGAHLALSLERLDALRGDAAPAQRVGLSATVRPVEEVATFLGGTRPVTVVQPPSPKRIELRVVVPVEDMTELDTTPGRGGGDEDNPAPRRSIWPHVEERVLDLIEQHKSTIVFANSRRLAERLCGRLNELAAERAEAAGEAALSRLWETGGQKPPAEIPAAKPPAEIMAQAGVSRGARGGRQGTPRLGVPAGAGGDRGSAQGGSAARRGGHIQPGARYRHGRGGPGRSGRGAALGGQRAAAGRPGRAQRRRRVPRHHLPQVPGRPGPGGGGGRATGLRHRGTEDPAQPAGRAGPADRGDDGGRRLGCGRARADGAQGRAVRRADQADPRGGAGHAGRALPERGVRRAAAAPRLGPGGGHHPGPARCAAARRHQRRHDP